MAKMRAARAKNSVEKLFDKQPKKSHEIIAHSRSQELFFGVVGPVGAGSSRAIDSLERACRSSGFKAIRVKASALIKERAAENGKVVPSAERKTLAYVSALQNLGDDMREDDSSAVARAAVIEIAKRRAEHTSQRYQPGQPILPDDQKRAYLIDSIRHPAEINLLRRTYGGAFALIGVVCEEKERKRRILGKYFTKPEQLDDKNQTAVDAFMRRDADDAEKGHGQHVNDAFFESDFFVDNTAADDTDANQLLDEDLGRLIDIITHDKMVRPTIEETAMHHAHSARVRSACLSRQVGASLVDADGTVISTGVNEVPKGGGGVYGEDFRAKTDPKDDRCAFRSTRFCSSNREQNKIIDDLISSIPELGSFRDKEALRSKIRKTRIGQLIEFSRAVHAEMDALLSASREGVSTCGTRLFVTTFPCHYCARHIVSAGVREVHYIEPYPKSLAVELHRDSIETNRDAWKQANLSSVKEGEEPTASGMTKVLFTPFVGVAPRLYIRAFEKKWRLKDKDSGDFDPKPPEWGDEWAPFTLAYPELEAVLTRER